MSEEKQKQPKRPRRRYPRSDPVPFDRFDERQQWLDLEPSPTERTENDQHRSGPVWEEESEWGHQTAAD